MRSANRSAKLAPQRERAWVAANITPSCISTEESIPHHYRFPEAQELPQKPQMGSAITIILFSSNAGRAGIQSFSQNPHSLFWQCEDVTKLGTVSTDRTEITPFKITWEEERWLAWSSACVPRTTATSGWDFLQTPWQVKAPFLREMALIHPKLLPPNRLQTTYCETSWTRNAAAVTILPGERTNLDDNRFSSRFSNVLSPSQYVVVGVQGHRSLPPQSL